MVFDATLMLLNKLILCARTKGGALVSVFNFSCLLL